MDMQIETTHLILRPFAESDAGWYQAIAADSYLWRIIYLKW